MPKPPFFLYLFTNPIGLVSLPLSIISIVSSFNGGARRVICMRKNGSYNTFALSSVHSLHLVKESFCIFLIIQIRTNLLPV